MASKSLDESWRTGDEAESAKAFVEMMVNALAGKDPELGTLSPYGRNVLMQRVESVSEYLDGVGKLRGVADPHAASRAIVHELAMQAANYMREYDRGAGPQTLDGNAGAPALALGGLLAWTAVSVADHNQVALVELRDSLTRSDAILYWRALDLNGKTRSEAGLVDYNRAAEVRRLLLDEAQH
jgi:hypothetical protein